MLFFSYKNYKAYQPFNIYWHEQGLLLHSEFRDGNVPAGYEQLRLLKESLNRLPVDVDTVYMRSDSAGYQQELLEYCATGANGHFNAIEFAIAMRVTKSFKKAVSELKEADWQPIEHKDDKGNVFLTNQEFAEVCFVPSWVAQGDSQIEYRYIAIREKMIDKKTGSKKDDELPFQTVNMNKQKYKLFGIVTNRDLPGSELIQWHRERCGDSEKVHSVEKGQLAGGQFPSNLFGANAAWWHIMVLAFNLNQLMRVSALPEELKTKCLKGLRFHIIGVAGRVIQHARATTVKLAGGAATLQLFDTIRTNLARLFYPLPSG